MRGQCKSRKLAKYSSHRGMAAEIVAKPSEDTKAEQTSAAKEPVEEKKALPVVAELTEEKLAKQKEKRLQIKAEIKAMRQVLDDLRNNVHRC